MARPRPWREWTIRSRMVVTIVGLAALALIVANAAAILFLRGFLIGRLDDQLQGQRHGPIPGYALCDQSGASGNRRLLLFDATTGETIVPAGRDGQPICDPPDPATGPRIGDWSGVQRHIGRGPYTVDGGDGQQWRVVVTDTQRGLVKVDAVSMRDVTATRNDLLAIDGALTAVVLLLLGLAAASVVRIGLRPLTHMADTAAEIAGTDDLSRRVEDADPHTETGRLGGALNAMLVRIEAALAARTASEQRLRQFLADASHELRTPLTSIQGFAELYRRGGTPPGPELDEAMGRIESEVARMRVLVNDLLVLAKLDEERPLDRRPVDLLGVAADTVRDAHVRVPTRFVALSAIDDARDTFEPVTVLGDADRLAQVATNLVANALQHTPEDTRVVVRVGRPTSTESREPTATIGAELADDVPLAVLEVADTGPGMPTDDAHRVFERLFRAERSRDRRHGGAGLGLAIVAAIVTQHGGRVELYTAPGEGATFRVLLPAEPDELLDPEFAELT